MATGGQGPPYLTNKERTNFARLSRAIIDLGTQVLRDVLSRKIPPSQIRHEAHICRNLKLNSSQQSKLKSAPTKGYDEFDISLLYILIRKCSTIKPTEDWSNPPKPGNETEGDDVERIHYIRNQIYGHLADTCISDFLFGHYWQILQEVMTRMDSRMNGRYSLALSFIETDCMDKETEMLYTKRIEEMEKRDQDVVEKINNLEQKFDQLCKSVAETRIETFVHETYNKYSDAECRYQNTLAAIRSHSKDETFVRVKSCKTGHTTLKTHGILIYIGLPGSGKTTNATEIIVKFTKEFPEWKVWELDDVTKWDSYVNPQTPTLVLLDDVLGISNTNISLVNNGNRYWKKIYSCVSEGNVKVIMTMRTNIFYDAWSKLEFHKIFKEKYIIDLSSDEFQLDEEEKREIFLFQGKSNKLEVCRYQQQENYMSECILNEDVPVKISECTLNTIMKTNPIIGFPQVCAVFHSCRKYTRLGEKFFRNPAQTVIDEMDALRNSANKTENLHFCILVYMLINQSEIVLGSLDESKWNTVQTAVGLLHTPSNLTLKDALCGINNKYIKNIKNNIVFKFKHETILEAVAVAFARSDIHLILQTCEMNIIVEFIRTKSYKEKEGEIIIKLFTLDEYKAMAKRLMQGYVSEEAQWHYRKWISHQAFTDSDFVSTFIEVVIQNTEFYESLKSSCMDLFGILHVACMYDAVLIVEKLNNLFKSDIVTRTNNWLVAAIVGKATTTVQWLLDNLLGSQDITVALIFVNCTETLNCLASHTSVKPEHLKYLCKFADSITTEIILNRWPLLETPLLCTLLYAMCLNGDIISVSSMLTRFQNSDLKPIMFKCLQITSARGHFNLFEYILSQIDILQEREKLMLVHIAAYYGRFKIVDYILKSSEPRQIEQSTSNTTVTKAAILGYVHSNATILDDHRPDFIRKLTELEKCHSDESSEYHQLFSFLLESETINFAEISMTVDDSGNTVGHYAVIFNDIPLIEMLLKKYKTVLQMQNNQGYTPIQFAAFLGQTNVYMLLKTDQIVEKSNPTDFLLASIGWSIPHFISHRNYDSLDLTFQLPTCLQVTCFRHSDKLKHYTDLVIFFIRTCEGIETDLRMKLDNIGNTCLHFFVAVNNSAIVKMLIEKYPDMLLLTNDDNQTVLHIAAYYGRAKIFQLLYEHLRSIFQEDIMPQPGPNYMKLLCLGYLYGLQIDGRVVLKNKIIRVPNCLSLMYFRNNYLPVMQYLLGIDQRYTQTLAEPIDNFGNTIAHYCVVQNDVPMLDFLQCYCKTVVYTLDDKNYTPKHFAAYFGRTEMLKLLSEDDELHCVALAEQEQDNYLELAIVGSISSMAKSHMPEPLQCLLQMLKALLYAPDAFFNNEDLVTIELRAGLKNSRVSKSAYRSVRPDISCTETYEFASIFDYIEIIKILLKHDQNVEAFDIDIDKYCNGLAHYCVLFNSVVMLNFVAKTRPSLLLKQNCQTLTPIQLAALLGRSRIFKLLYEYKEEFRTETYRKSCLALGNAGRRFQGEAIDDSKCVATEESYVMFGDVQHYNAISFVINKNIKIPNTETQMKGEIV